MEREALKTKVFDIVADQLGEEVQALTERTKLEEDCGMDSIDAIELVLALEEEYSIEIPDEDAEKILIVKDIIDYVMEKVESL